MPSIEPRLLSQNSPLPSNPPLSPDFIVLQVTPSNHPSAHMGERFNIKLRFEKCGQVEPNFRVNPGEILGEIYAIA
jgi:hypothetical protein